MTTFNGTDRVSPPQLKTIATSGVAVTALRDTAPTDTVPATSGVRIVRTGPRGLSNPTSDFADLLNTVRDAGLLRRHRRFYIMNFLVVSAAMAAAWIGFVSLRGTWYELLIAAAIGILLTQYAFMGHESAHRQVWASPAANDLTARILCDLFVGMSYSWWMNKHSRHHASAQHRRPRSRHRARLPGLPGEAGARTARNLQVAGAQAGLDLLPGAHARGPEPAHAGVPNGVLAGTRRQAGARDRVASGSQHRVHRGRLRVSAARDWPSPSSACRWRSSGSTWAPRSPRTTRGCRRSRPMRASTSCVAR